jgi:hypothetical protein
LASLDLFAFMEQTPWKAVALAVMALPKHGKLRVPRDSVPHPAEAGLYRSTGLNRKCSGHYRHAMADGRGLHVHVYETHYHVHWDAVDPSVSLLRHFLHDVVDALTRPLRKGAAEAAAVRPLAFAAA